MKLSPEIPATGAQGVIVDISTLLNMREPNIQQDIATGRDPRVGVGLTREDIVPHFGEPAQTFYPNVFGKRLPWILVQGFFLERNSQFPRRLHPGTLALLDTLQTRDIPVGLVTVCSRTVAERHIADHNNISPDQLLGRFATTWFGEDIANPETQLQPYGHLLDQALSKSSLGTDGIMVVGTEPSSQRAALEHDLPFIAMTTDLTTAAKFEGQGNTPVVNDLYAVQRLLLGQTHST
ncbi:MAG TPA: hypothetical protein VJ836_00555 [Candidatus Saccharimonadales bacterium]|nr:hypothetical protein [Candidatus Saccharimonadales bacterium]